MKKKSMISKHLPVDHESTITQHAMVAGDRIRKLELWMPLYRGKTPDEDIPLVKMQPCCYCGLDHASNLAQQAVNKPHLHFAIVGPKQMFPMHHVGIAPLHPRTKSRIRYSGDFVQFEIENTICLEHLFEDPTHLWSLLEEMYDVNNEHSTNARNVGAAIHVNGFVDDRRVGISGRPIRLLSLANAAWRNAVLSLSAPWRSDALRHFWGNAFDKYDTFHIRGE